MFGHWGLGNHIRLSLHEQYEPFLKTAKTRTSKGKVSLKEDYINSLIMSFRKTFTSHSIWSEII